jgi:hypothetical protein
MKSGLDNKRNVVILSVLAVMMVGAVVYFANSMFGGSNPAAAPAQQTTTAHNEPGSAAGSHNEGGRAAEKLPPLEKLDPTLHPELMAGAEALEYNGTGRNIFSLVSEPPKIEQVKGPIRPQPVVQPQIAQGPPPPPPIDLKFFGYEAAGGARKAFLLHGDDVFIAMEGDVVDHHYKVLKITPLSIQVTDLLYNNTQTLALTQS